MPPRSSLTSSFSVTDANNEVVCPLKNNDGSNCRKRCLGVSIPILRLPYLSIFIPQLYPAQLAPPHSIPGAPHLVEHCHAPGDFPIYTAILHTFWIYHWSTAIAIELYNLTMFSYLFSTNRKSAIVPCRSISDVRIRTTTSRSSRLPRRASF